MIAPSNCRDGTRGVKPVLGDERARSDASRKAESKVIVAKGRIELAAQCDTADCVRVAPRAAAGGTSHAVGGAGRIPLG